MPARAVTAEDAFRFRLVSDPQLAPYGTRVAYVLQRADREKNRYFSNLHVAPVDAAGRPGEGDRSFTRGDQRDTTPRWSPDGSRLAFLSDRGECSQVWLLPADGGEAAPLTKLEEGAIGELHWSPGGTRLAFTYRPKPAWARNSAREEREKAHRSTPPLVVRRLAYREEGTGYLGDERRHVFVVEAATGAVAQLTRGEWDVDSLTWSPEGDRIAFVTNRSPDPDRTPQLREIRVVPAADGEEERVEAPAGPKSALAWSPDGRWIACYGNTDARDVWSAADPQLWLLPAPGNGQQARCVSASLDRPVGDCTLGDLRSFGGGWTGPVWSPDSEHVYFLVSDRGSCHVYRVAARGGAPENLTPGLRGEAASLSFDAAGGRLATVLGDPSSPGEVHVAEKGSPCLTLRRLTAANDALLAELELARPEEVTAPSPEGPVHGWLLRPPGERAEPAPLVLYIHGGPHTQYGWQLMHEFQVLAARGLAVLYTNPRGSRGYGQAHVDAIRGDWGGPDYRDLMAAVDHAAALPGIDPDRLAVTGGSYGGYMTNWIAGQTDRFRAAVTQRSVANLHSMSGTCDFFFGCSDYFGGNSWSEPGPMLAQSPLTHAARVGTPMLILHSEGDLRCPIEQAEQWFAALKAQGREVEFVRYPREANHGLSRSGPPDLRLDRLQRIAAWLERWLLPGG